MSGSGEPAETREPLRAEVTVYAHERWGSLTDDQAVKALVAILHSYPWPGCWTPVFIRGIDGKVYPSGIAPWAVRNAHVLAAHLLARGIGLRDLARRLNMSHATLRRWAIKAQTYSITGRPPD